MEISDEQPVAHFVEAASYQQAAATVTALVNRIPDGVWDDPALQTWDVRTLVGHTSRALSTVTTYLARPAESEDIPSPEAYYALAVQRPLDRAAIDERARQAGVDLGGDPSSAFAASAERACASIRAADPDSVIMTISGGMRVATYLPTRTFELVVHGLDIAHATALDVEFSAPVIADSTSLAARIAASLGQGPPVLRALTGRAPLPASFSVTK